MILNKKYFKFLFLNKHVYLSDKHGVVWICLKRLRAIFIPFIFEFLIKLFKKYQYKSTE